MLALGTGGRRPGRAPPICSSAQALTCPCPCLARACRERDEARALASLALDGAGPSRTTPLPSSQPASPLASATLPLASNTAVRGDTAHAEL